MLTGIIIATIAIIFAYLGARVWTRVIRPELRPELIEYQVGDPRLPKIYNEGE